MFSAKVGDNMKNIFGNKAVSSVNVIKGDDGPTSFFIVGRNNSKQTLNNTAEMTGVPHNLFMFFPAKTPIITEYIGFTAKNNIKHTAIPASPFTKKTASHGKTNMITKEIIIQSIKLFFIFMDIL